MVQAAACTAVGASPASWKGMQIMEYITRDALDILQDQIIDADLNAGVHERYSGRGMFGTYCIGFVVPSLRDGFRLAAIIAQSWSEQQVTELMEAVATDAMGLGTIIYFPGWQAEPADEGDHDEAG